MSRYLLWKGRALRLNPYTARAVKNSPLPLSWAPVLCSRLSLKLPQGAPLMEWVTPQHEEIDLNCEISSYANAEL